MNNTDNAFHGFMKLPKELYINSEFAALSSDAKILFTMILDRTELSYKNRERFTDEGGEVFIYFTIEQICEKLGCSNKKAVSLLRQLVKSDFIIKKRKGCGLPSRIILTQKSKAFIQPYVNDTFVKCNNNTSESVKNTFQKVSKQHTINTYNNNNDMSKTDPSIFYNETVEEIREQIEYDCINADADIVEEIILIMADVMTYPGEMVRIGSVDYPKSVVVQRYKRLDSLHIEEVVDRLESVEIPVYNVRNYLMTLLFNAPLTFASGNAAQFAYHYPEYIRSKK